MNYIDYIILVVFLFFTVKGLLRGFFHEVLGLVGILVGLVLATKYMSDFSGWMAKLIDLPSIAILLLAFIIIFSGVIILSQLLASALEKLSKYSMLGWLEKIAGGIIGFVKGGLIISLLLLFITVIPFGKELIPGLDGSRFYEPARNFAPRFFNLMVKIFPNSKTFYREVKETFDNFATAQLARNTQTFLESLQADDPSKDENRSSARSR
jgi:membrane protein required for colicin V production